MDLIVTSKPVIFIAALTDAPYTLFSAYINIECFECKPDVFGICMFCPPSPGVPRDRRELSDSCRNIHARGRAALFNAAACK